MLQARMSMRGRYVAWHETDGLVTDSDGHLWIRGEWAARTAGLDEWPDRCLGRLEDNADEVPAALRQEYAEHLDLWRDSLRWDEEAEVRATYRRQQGF